MASLSPEELQSRFDEFCEWDEKRNNLFKDLLRKTVEDATLIDSLKIDLENERDSRIRYQKELRDLVERKSNADLILNKDPYVAVLVDGDGAKFLDALLQDPHKGGAEAALRLKQEVRNYLQNTPLGTEDIPIIVRVFANLNALAKALRSANIISSETDMHTFAEQFTISRAEFDFVNVGYGKENADSKMRKMFSHYYKNFQCKKIFFAGCHDYGYLHELRECKGDRDAKDRVVLLETTPAESSFRSLGFPMVRFDSIFRCEFLKNERTRGITTPSSAKEALGLQSAELGVRRASETSSVFDAQIRVPTPASAASTGAQSPALAQRSPALSVTASGNGGVSVSYPPSYAKAGGANGHQNIAIPVSKGTAKRPRVIEWNKYDQRLDPPNKYPGVSDEIRFNQKREKIKPVVLCNEFYLTGRCKRRVCDKHHEEAYLTPAEITVLRYKARTTMCPKGPDCKNFECYLSHHCPFNNTCRYGASCKFWKTDWGNLHMTVDSLVPA
ncbi:hypothetical protein MAP00_002937 [Monascus purpureus]|nr:hypothetical protein MAP00_002937 [Monascus purpureus]